ncbi:MAG TPA: hypothetical protein VK681_39325 [Reyranella sp.]|nr:hypothetical protein [Reyranella sp.]
MDCDGTGRVKHCVACAGRGKLWLGGSDYLDCPECGGKGYPKPNRTHVQSKGIIPVYLTAK